MSHPARFTFIIPNGGTDTPALSSMISKGNARSTLGNSSSITVFGPAALTGVVTVQVSARYGSDVWHTLQDAGADVTVAAGKARELPRMLGIEDLRLHSAGAEGAQRDIDVVCKIDMD